MTRKSKPLPGQRQKSSSITGSLAMEGIPSRRILAGNRTPSETDDQIISGVVPIWKDRKHQPTGIDEAQWINGPQILLTSLYKSPNVGLLLVRYQAYQGGSRSGVSFRVAQHLLSLYSLRASHLAGTTGSLVPSQNIARSSCVWQRRTECWDRTPCPITGLTAS